jgi:transposase-like protein
MGRGAIGHSPEFRQWVIEKAITLGNITRAAREAKLARSVVNRWVRAYRQNGAGGLQFRRGRPPGRKASPEKRRQLEDLDLLRRKVGEQQVMIDFLSEACKRVGAQPAPSTGNGGAASTPPSKR